MTDKINVALYGGKSIFGGRETPLEKDTVYCDRYNECSLYKKGKCFSAGRWKENCKFGKKTTEIGYTSRAKKYYSFKANFEKEECKYKLEEPKNKIAKVGDTFILDIGYLYIDNETGKYKIETHWSKSPLIYINEKDFDNSLIKLICDGEPRTIFDNVIIKDYKQKIVPQFLYELKNEYINIYENFIEEYPEYKDIQRDFKGEYAYIKSLKNGIELKDCHNNIWIKQENNIICKNWKTWLPFKGSNTKVVIEIPDDMIYEIKDNSEIDENTIFKDI